MGSHTHPTLHEISATSAKVAATNKFDVATARFQPKLKESKFHFLAVNNHVTGSLAQEGPPG
jgi:hypothetical protein